MVPGLTPKSFQQRIYDMPSSPSVSAASVYYLCRPVRKGWHLSKWEGDSNQPSVVYEMWGNGAGGKWNCTCPSPRRPCKHSPILAEFLGTSAPMESLYYAEGVGLLVLSDLKFGSLDLLVSK